ncbi:MAG: hypothetical protein INH41_27715 [Myxococcaceae bacterium]|jgi:hypothetical protein|nr:hypothetical protein [Myxococcaceae bacterium]MCA3016189.1 hypothetical protein [Myxococcaceae bacterium]
MRLWGVLVIISLGGCEGAVLGGAASGLGAPDSRVPASDPSPVTAEAGEPSGPFPSSAEPVAPFTCQPGLAALEPLQRLTREQYRLALTGLFDGPALSLVDAELAALPPDVLGQALEATDRARSFAEAQVLLFNAIAHKLGDAMGSAPQRLDGCLANPSPDTACLERALGTLATKAWRRDGARFPRLRAVCHPASRTAMACIVSFR